MALWQVRRRESNQLIDHLCRSRSLDPHKLVPDFGRDLFDPYFLPDMEKAVSIIEDIQQNNGFVTIFGDYDADGTPASALLSLTFNKLGIRHQVILPTRQDGYGLSDKIAGKIDPDSQLLITVDNGITACREIEQIKQRGIKVIILDHHLPLDEVPKADAIIDPYLKDSNYPFKELCGCALAFKFTQALSVKFPEIGERFYKWLLDLVAISTVADMMPLTGENRALVHYGLIVLEKDRRPGLKYLKQLAGLRGAKLSSYSLGFVLGPRLNASGRLEDNTPALRLLLAEGDEEALSLAQQIERNNRERLRMIDEMTQMANDVLFKQNSQNDRMYVVTGQDWSLGLVGLVAGRLSQIYNRPVIVGTVLGGDVKASARSINSYHILEAIDAHNAYLSRYGGHRRAAGLSGTADQWPRFVDSIKRHAQQTLTDDHLEKVYLADAQLEGEEINLSQAQEIETLQPFGLGNEEPLFILRNVLLTDFRKVGSNQNHLKLSIKKGGKFIKAIAFNQTGTIPVSSNENCDLLGKLKVNSWRQVNSVEFEVVDWQKSPATVKTIG